MLKDCTHIKESGAKCGATVVKDSEYCYHHQEHRRRTRRIYNTMLGKATALEPFMSGAAAGKDPVTKRVYDALFSDLVHALELPPLDSPEDVDVHLSSIQQLIATQQVDPRLTAQMLHDCRIAVSNHANRLKQRALAMLDRQNELRERQIALQERMAALAERRELARMKEAVDSQLSVDSQKQDLAADLADHADKSKENETSADSATSAVIALADDHETPLTTETLSRGDETEEQMLTTDDTDSTDQTDQPGESEQEESRSDETYLARHVSAGIAIEQQQLHSAEGSRGDEVAARKSNQVRRAQAPAEGSREDEVAAREEGEVRRAQAPAEDSREDEVAAPANDQQPTTNDPAPARGGFVHKTDAWYEKKDREADEHKRRDDERYLAKSFKRLTEAEEKQQRRAQVRDLLKAGRASAYESS